MEIFLLITAIICICFIVWLQYFKIRQKKKDIKRRGELGEKIIATILDVNGGKILNNYIILDNFNKTHQIDHVLINKCGIFVIETKAYSGFIYGDENQEKWTQVLAFGKVKNQFYNPVKQNATHYYQIKNLIKDNLIPIFSCVVFVNGNIDNVRANNVFDTDGLISFVNEKPEKLSEFQIENLYGFLESKRAKNITELEHILSINKTLQDINNNICPRCKGKLVIRNGRYGQFYGCSNFPKCKFKKRINTICK